MNASEPREVIALRELQPGGVESADGGGWWGSCLLCGQPMKVMPTTNGAVSLHCKDGCDPALIARRLNDVSHGSAQASTAEEVLACSRVDLLARIDGGIPERQYVPGADGLLPKGKRIHVSAKRKTGKSLVFGVVQAVEIVAAGGTVAVLDRENGADEYARRLRDVLNAHDADGELRERLRERLRYHEWPKMRLDWADDPTYPAAFDHADVVVFDSSRSHTSPLGFKENESDDYSAFVGALIDPLMRAGITVVVLDNVGHEAKDRARGTTAKEDLCDVAFTMTELKTFTSTTRGHLELKVVASRIGEVAGSWQMVLGGGYFGDWERAGAKPPEAREDLRQATVEVLTAAHPEPLGQLKVGTALRERGLKVAKESLRSALSAWVSDSASGVVSGPNGQGYTVELGHVGAPRHAPHVATGPTRPDTANGKQAKTPAAAGDLPMSQTADTARHGGHVGDVAPRRGDTPDPPVAQEPAAGLFDDDRTEGSPGAEGGSDGGAADAPERTLTDELHERIGGKA